MSSLVADYYLLRKSQHLNTRVNLLYGYTNYQKGNSYLYNPPSGDTQLDIMLMEIEFVPMQLQLSVSLWLIYGTGSFTALIQTLIHQVGLHFLEHGI